MTKSANDFSGYQEHPRYGRGPRITGLNPSDQPYSENIFLHWHSRSDARIPNTAIKADITRQAKATIHVTHYFDSKRVCRKCGAYFIFFAEEQKYWYEELRFPLEADMVECINCRQQEKRLQEMRLEYEALLAKPSLPSEGTLRLVMVGIELVSEGIFSVKALPRLRGHLGKLGSAHENEAELLKLRMNEIEQRDS